MDGGGIDDWKFFLFVAVAAGWIFFWLRVFFFFVLWPLVVLIVVSSKFVSVYVVFGLWVREKKGLKFGNREEGKYVLLVREKIQEETVPKVGGNQSAGYVKWVL